MAHRLKVLLVDDDAGFLRRFEVLASEIFEVSTARTAAEGIERIRRHSPEAVLLDVDLGSGASGIEVLEQVRRDDPDLPVIMISGDESLETIVRAMKAGANDYVSKHPNLEILRLKVERALEQTHWRAHARDMQSGAAGGLVGSSPPMAALRENIRRIAATKVRVFIQGESGTGKELVAAAIHAESPRRSERFVALSGAVGTEELFDSDLFGHESGAFTGASQRRKGKLELADHGTLFLDEIGKMPRSRQAKLLRVLETGRFERLGGTDEIECDVRFLSASNEDIEEKIERGEFLADLLYRIGDYRLLVPPLRERLEDVPLLARFLLDRFSASERLERIALAPGALDPLYSYSWPGNIRELDAVLKRAVILSDSPELDGNALRNSLNTLRNRTVRTPALPPASASTPEPAARLGPESPLRAFVGEDYETARLAVLHAFDRIAIERELARHGGNATLAYQRLGIAKTLFYRRMKDAGMGRGRSSDSV